jgi:hypothetical protein
MNTKERKQSLLEQYRFDCKCGPCSSSSKSCISNLKCFKCNASSTQAISESMEIKCFKCSTTTSITKYTELYETIEFSLNQLGSDEYAKCVQLIDTYRKLLFINEENEIDFNLLRSSLDDNFKLFYLDYARLLDVLARLSCDMNMFRQAADLTEKSIHVLENCYGKESIELLNEILKLAEIQFNCQLFDLAISNADKGILIASKLCSDESKILKEFVLLKKNIQNIQAI